MIPRRPLALNCTFIRSTPEPHTNEIIEARREIMNGERIHLVKSHKFTRERIEREAAEVGFELERIWTDYREWFAVCLLTPREGG